MKKLLLGLLTLVAAPAQVFCGSKESQLNQAIDYEAQHKHLEEKIAALENEKKIAIRQVNLKAVQKIGIEIGRLKAEKNGLEKWYEGLPKV